jgi:hypothetical protein
MAGSYSSILARRSNVPYWTTGETGRWTPDTIRYMRSAHEDHENRTEGGFVSNSDTDLQR